MFKKKVSKAVLMVSHTLRPEPRHRNQNLQVDADLLYDLRQCICVPVSPEKE
jgi:hypothetical protein